MFSLRIYNAQQLAMHYAAASIFFGILSSPNRFAATELVARRTHDGGGGGPVLGLAGVPRCVPGARLPFLGPNTKGREASTIRPCKEG